MNVSTLVRRGSRTFQLPFPIGAVLIFLVLLAVKNRFKIK